ncbi:DUF2267 domain-containing protein [Streptomyces odontomachi]|uniref:DUF2267 domain-containing protein n=1 Tax=Streptomyces odontomachi TaxID=2944940 RepID=UPI00210B2645|nr:DUF2267 domain-containing protein [Streptomyces sp. ODS25]
MKYDEFVAKVQDRGKYDDRRQSERAMTDVLQLFGQRITAGEAEDLASQLPDPLGEVVLRSRSDTPESFGVTEFLRRLARQEGASPESAEKDAKAVLSTLGQAVSGGELNQVISQLPSGYAALLGKPELT